MQMEALRVLEPYFWRAPSAHNAQPWVLRYGDDVAEVGWDPRCELPAGDPSGRDLRLSLGAFIETCLVVCADARQPVGFLPDYSQAGRRAGYLVPAADIYRTPFTRNDVTGRRTSRGAYRPGPLCEEAITCLRDAAVTAHADVRLLACRDIAGLLHAADRHLFGSPPVVGELREWLRLTPSHPAYRADGLNDQTLALSRLEACGLRAVLARRVYPLLRRIGLPLALASASSGLLDYDGQVVVLIAPPIHGPSRQIDLGRVLMRQWLTLSRHGYTTHPLSQIIDCPSTRDALAERLGVTDPDRVVSVFRAGPPAAPAARAARRVPMRDGGDADPGLLQEVAEGCSSMTMQDGLGAEGTRASVIARPWP